jgi:cytochrome c-type biogenesis protein CcmE
MLKRRKNMLKEQITLLLGLLLTFPLAMAVVAQEAPTKAKEARWEGNIIRTNKDDSTLTVRKVGTTNDEKIVHYDSSTKWVSQYHGDTKVNDIKPDQVKEGDRVICTGTWDTSGAMHATVISLRLSHSPH